MSERTMKFAIGFLVMVALIAILARGNEQEADAEQIDYAQGTTSGICNPVLAKVAGGKLVVGGEVVDNAEVRVRVTPDRMVELYTLTWHGTDLTRHVIRVIDPSPSPSCMP